MAHNFRAHLRADLVGLGLPFLFVSKAGAAGQPGTPDAPVDHAAAGLASPYTGGIGRSSAIPQRFPFLRPAQPAGIVAGQGSPLPAVAGPINGITTASVVPF